MSLSRLFIALFAVLSFSSLIVAAPQKSKKPKRAMFPSGPMIERKVQFWEAVFTRYSSQQILVHDVHQPDLILGVMPYAKGSQAKADYTKSFDRALRDFTSSGEKAKAKSALHKRIWKVYRNDDQAKSRLLSGRAKLRTQLGLSDIFHAAALRAQKHLPGMEKIFAAHGLPLEITRLPFVESMFQEKIRSKVGAAGLWQLMPEAAKSHLVVSALRDERDIPLKATTAAARIMRANYHRLGNWPLAITAYNHGVNGVARGVKTTGSDQLPELILSYKSKSFGFASRNFYAEFLAAHRSYEKWQLAQKSKTKKPSKQLVVAE